jgi:hypothetical protein
VKGRKPGEKGNRLGNGCQAGKGRKPRGKSCKSGRLGDPAGMGVRNLGAVLGGAT